MAADKSPQPADGAAAAAAAAARRDRSPNYPALTYSEAESHARKLWDFDKRHLMTKDVAATHLGYSKSSGATLPLFAAMKRYGLVEYVGTEIKVTDEAHFIFVHEEHDPERIAMRKRLAMLPSLFGEVLQKFSGGLPSDATLKAKLQTDFKFASAEAAETFIKALREAVAIADVAAVADQVPGVDNSAVPTKEVTMATPQELAIRPTLSSTNAPRPQVQVPLPPVQLVNTSQSRTWDLGDTAVMTVILPPGGLSKKNVARLKKYVAALEMEARIAWEDDVEDEDFGGK